ncbi:MAG: hypothetical protein J6A28_01310 [Clostridia bacterium]|nr:hypothetical protein [Clostridia bacterium]
MGKKITVQAYDGKLVTIDESQLEDFRKNTQLIKKLIAEGKSQEEIKEILKEKR